MQPLDLVPLIFIAVIFWFLLLRPQQRRAREVRSMQQALGVGDDVMLTSGVYGTLTEVDDETVRLEIAPGVTIRVARGAIGARIDAPTDEPGEPQVPAPEEN